MNRNPMAIKHFFENILVALSHIRENAALEDKQLTFYIGDAVINAYISFFAGKHQLFSAPLLN